MRVIFTCLTTALLLLAPSLFAGPYGPTAGEEVIGIPGSKIESPVAVTVLESNQAKTVLSYSLGSYNRTPFEINGEIFYEISVPGEATQL